MKKFLLFAAMAATLLGVSAQDYIVEQVWRYTGTIPAYGDCRQGVGLNGKFYINDKSNETVLVFSEEGQDGELELGGANCGLNTDQAGHLIVSLATFPYANSWAFDDVTPMIRVIDPNTQEYVDLPLGAEAPNSARLDVLGRAHGDLLGDGEIYLPQLPAGGGCINRYFYSEGEINADDCYSPMLSPTPGADNMTIVSAVVDADGNDAIFYYQRGSYPYLYQWNGDNLEGGKIVIPEADGMIRCNQNGADFFAFKGKNFVVYPLGAADNAYYDGFGIYEVGADAPLFKKEPTIATAPNNFQANWLNAEVDGDCVMIYQYVPGKSMEVYKMSLPATEIQKVYILGEVNDNVWDPTMGLEMTLGEDNLYTAEITCDGRNSGYNYFGFTTELAENNDQGGWNYIEPFRFGAVSEGDFDVTDQMLNAELELTYDDGQAFKIPAGEYKLTVNLETMKLVINPIIETREIEGNVIDVDGNPIEDVVVTATPVAEEMPVGMKRAGGDVYTTTTDADGHYSLIVPADADYLLTFEKVGYKTVTLSEMEAEVVEMEEDQTVTAVNSITAGKTVAAVKYVNVAGQVSNAPFDGVNMVVTIYTDGSKTATKIVK